MKKVSVIMALCLMMIISAVPAFADSSMGQSSAGEKVYVDHDAFINQSQLTRRTRIPSTVYPLTDSSYWGDGTTSLDTSYSKYLFQLGSAHEMERISV